MQLAESAHAVHVGQVAKVRQVSQENVHAQAAQGGLTFFGSIVSRDKSYLYRRLKDGCCPKEFSSFLARDEHNRTAHPADPARYSDILGHDAELAWPVLGWRYACRPISVGVFEPNGHLVSIAYATLISFEDRRNTSRTPEPTETQRTGVNLSYAVDSQHEGQGLALAASCLVIKLAAQHWPTLDHRHDINIQTKASNAPSVALAARLGALPCPEADFSIFHSDSSVRRYTGFRRAWPDMVANANANLSKFFVLADFEDEDEDHSNDSPSPSQ